MSEASVKVSIVISAYNYVRSLGLAIESALNQKFDQGFEVIVVNDASTDETETLCQSYVPRIIYVRHPVNQGPSAARNTGMRMARGEYVMTLDADDELLPEAVQWYAKTLDRFPYVGLVYGDFIRHNLEKGTRNRHRSLDFDRGSLEKKNIVYCSSQMFRKSLALDLGGYAPGISCGEDWDLWLRLTEKSCAIHVPAMIEVRTLKSEGQTARVHEKKQYDLERKKTLVRLKKRRWLARVQSVFSRGRTDSLTLAWMAWEQDLRKQGLRQAEILLRVLMFSSAWVFEQRTRIFHGLKTLGVQMDFEAPQCVVFWHVLEAVDEKESQNRVQETLNHKPLWIVLRVETRECFESAFDRPTQTREAWVSKFSSDYDEYPFRVPLPVKTPENWFEQEGLESLVILRRKEGAA